jgi:type I restriction-modification system DNA methylase subunit
MSLFQKSVINKYLKTLDSVEVGKSFLKFKEFYGNQARLENIRLLKEENYQEGFFREIFVQVLGYTINPDENYNLTTEFKNQTDAKKADGAIVTRGHDPLTLKAIGVIELKSTKTTSLESITEQAFNYKNHQPECRYIITSNFEKIRFYIDNATDFKEFNLFTLDENDFKILYLILSKTSIFSDIPLKLKKESVLHEENISKQLYQDYSNFKLKIFENLVQNNPQYNKLTLFKKSQKLLDRLIFIFFAEDSGLLPANSISRIIDRYNILKDEDAYRPLYEIYKQYFNYMNVGRKGKIKSDNIDAYNGGLFIPDTILDNIIIDDEILKDDSLKLSKYDFNTDLDVNILGHIFENSLNEIEELTAELEGKPLDKKKTKRKKEGIFYTPKYITKYIVENTVGELCDQKKKELNLDKIDISIIQNSRTKQGKLNNKAVDLLKRLKTYSDYLLSLKILDPACGSGAFLNQALEFLLEEHQFVDEYRRQLEKDSLGLFDVKKSILENNLYGVDINEESVEIAKLSLWLRTAERGRKLSDLSNSIKCGNSLIDDPDVAGEKAFKWEDEFSEIMANGGFDVVIGNPPYAKYNAISSVEKKFLSKSGIYGKTGDLAEFFIKKVIRNLLKENAHFSFIVPKGLTYVKSWLDIRELFLNSVNLIGLFDVSKAFKGVLYEMIIFHIQNSKSNSQNIKCGYFNEEKISSFLFNKKFYSKDIFYVGFPQSYLSILKKVKDNTFPVSYYMDYWYGKGGMTPLINTEGKGISVLTGKEVGRYKFKNTKEKWFLEEGLLSDIDCQRAMRVKIVVQDIVAHILNPKPHIQLTATIDKQKQFCLNTIMCFSENKKGLKNLFVLALINSKFMSFYYYYFVFNQAVRTIHFMPGYSDIMPIPKSFIDQEEHISSKSQLILELNEKIQSKTDKFLNRIITNFSIDKISKKVESFYDYDFKEFLSELKKQKIKLSLIQQEDWEDYFTVRKIEINELQKAISQTVNEIDCLVYGLYGLSKEEIQIVENSFEKSNFLE